jgi:hypothetical protein
MHLPKLTAGILASAAFASGQRAGRIVDPVARRSFRRMQSTEPPAKPEPAGIPPATAAELVWFGRPRGQVWNEWAGMVVLVAVVAGGVAGGVALVYSRFGAVNDRFGAVNERLTKVETTLHTEVDTKLAGVMKEVDAKVAGTKEALAKEMAGNTKETDAKLAGMKELVDEKVGKKRSGW